MELKQVIVESMLVIRIELMARNCCSVYSVKSGQFALFLLYASFGVVWCMCMFLLCWEGDQKEVCELFSMWSFVLVLGYVWRGCLIVPGAGCEYIVYYMLLICLLMSVPIVLFWFWSYQVVPGIENTYY